MGSMAITVVVIPMGESDQSKLRNVVGISSIITNACHIYTTVCTRSHIFNKPKTVPTSWSFANLLEVVARIENNWRQQNEEEKFRLGFGGTRHRT